jgi:NADPH-dependent 7-cyano-7-deazaguanine reductase QueF
VRTLNAKCLIPAQADFAVIQISARPNLRPAKLDQLSADNVKLTLKNQPTLPVRIVQR